MTLGVDECQNCEAPIVNGGWGGWCHDCDNQYIDEEEE